MKVAIPTGFIGGIIECLGMAKSFRLFYSRELHKMSNEDTCSDHKH